MKQREQIVSIETQVEVTAPPPGSGEVPEHTTLVYARTTESQKDPELFYLAAQKDLTGELNKKLAALVKNRKGILTVRDKAVVGVEVSPESCCLYLVRER